MYTYDKKTILTNNVTKSKLSSLPLEWTSSYWH